MLLRGKRSEETEGGVGEVDGGEGGRLVNGDGG